MWRAYATLKPHRCPVNARKPGQFRDAKVPKPQAAGSIPAGGAPPTGSHQAFLPGESSVGD
jgi:hypothetical protein